MTARTSLLFTDLPVALLQSVASFNGAPFWASKQFKPSDVLVLSDEVPPGVLAQPEIIEKVLVRETLYKEIFQSFSKELGAEKCQELVDDLSSRHIRLISEEDKLKGICFDLTDRCKLLRGGEEFLSRLLPKMEILPEKPALNHETIVQNDPFFCASTYKEIEQWIADENLLLICPHFFEDGWDNGVELDEALKDIKTNHAKRAQRARALFAQRKDTFTEAKLDNLGLTQFPTELLTCKNLVNLSLKGNRLTSVKFPAGTFPNLLRLDLGQNHLRSFTANPGALPQLNYLSLTDNQLTMFKVESEVKISEDVSEDDTDIITVHALPNLRELWLSDNQLETFTFSQGALPFLMDLGLRNNYLKEFNVENHRLRSLQNLRLDCNRMRHFQANRGVYPALMDLSLVNNELTAFHAAEGGYPCLIFLRLHHNKVNSFTFEEDALPRLKTLQLMYNLLQDFHVPAGVFHSLREMNLDHNRIATFTAASGAMPSLECLQLENNFLRTLALQEGSVPRLMYLYLNYNQLTSLIVTLGVFPRLLFLHIRHNLLQAFHYDPKVFPKLRRVTVDNNPFRPHEELQAFARKLHHEDDPIVVTAHT